METQKEIQEKNQERIFKELNINKDEYEKETQELIQQQNIKNENQPQQPLMLKNGGEGDDLFNTMAKNIVEKELELTNEKSGTPLENLFKSFEGTVKNEDEGIESDSDETKNYNANFEAKTNPMTQHDKINEYWQNKMKKNTKN